MSRPNATTGPIEPARRRTPRHPLAWNRSMMQRDLASAALGMTVELDELGHASGVDARARGHDQRVLPSPTAGSVFTRPTRPSPSPATRTTGSPSPRAPTSPFLKSTVAKQTLTATAVRRARSGRTGLYDVTVVDEQGDAVAEFRGRSISTNRTF